MENPYRTSTILPNYYHNTNNNKINNNNNNNSSLSPQHLAMSDSVESEQPPPPIISSSSSSHSYTSSSPSSHYRPSSLNNYDSGGLYRANQIFSSISGPQLVAKQQQQYQPYNNKQNGLLITEESNGSRFSMVSASSIVDPPRPPFIPKKPVFYASTNGVNKKEILSNNKIDNNKNEGRNDLGNEEERKMKIATNYEDASDFKSNGHQKPFLKQMQHSPKMKHSSKPKFDIYNNNNTSSIYHRNHKQNSYHSAPPPLPHRYHQQSLNSSPQHIYAPPITSTTVTTTAITTTYIGGTVPIISNANNDTLCNCSENCINKNEKCSNFSEKNSSTDGSTNSCSNNENCCSESFCGNEALISNGKDVSISNKLLKMGKPTCFEIAEKLQSGNNCKTSRSCTSYFPVVEQKEEKELPNNKNTLKNPPSPLDSASPSANAAAAALITADLRARFRESQNNLNDKEVSKRHSACVLQQQRRLSLVGAPSDSQQMTFSSNTTISSFGCSDAGKTREGRIYATAGFGAAAAARNRKKKLKNNNGIENKINGICEEENVKMRQESICGSQTYLNNDNNQLNCSNLMSNKNDQNYSGTLKSNSGTSIGAFSLGNEFSYETTGKSTLGRRAQKLAQRAALKLSKSGGTLSAELSSSASAIYALFSGNTSSNGFSNEKSFNGENRPENGSDDFLLGRKKASKRKGKKMENLSTSCYWMDKTTLVSKQTAKGIDFLDSFGLFIKERAQIEEEYATKLKNLTKKSRGKKASDDEFTSTSAFHAVLGELESLASQHELVGERLRDVLLPQISDKCRQLRSVRKKHSQGFELMEKDYNAKVDELQKQKKNYEKSHLDAQNAHIKFNRADQNRYLSRHDVDKARMAANNKSTICEQGKQNYAAQLAATNQAKNDFYNILLPRLLEEMRQLEIERIDFTRQIMMESVKAETDVLHIIQRCYEDMNNAIKTVNPEHDTLLVVEQTKTGYAHPADFEFEDLGNPELNEDDTTSFDSSTIRRIGAKNINGKGIPRKHSLKLFNNSIGNKSNGSTGGSHTSSSSNIGEYGNLPPQQRCRRIQKKLEELSNELSIKENSKDGLERLLSVYSNDPKMGDPQTVEKQIDHNKCEIDAINEQIKRFKNLLLDAQSELNQPLGGGGGTHLNTTTNSTISSSPNSSPRGSACSGGTGNNNVSRLNGLNGNNHHSVGERGSYSEASSISSADGAGSSIHGGVAVGHSSTNGITRLLPQPSPAQIVPSASPQTAIQQTSSTLSTSGFSSSSAALTPVTSSINIKQNIADANGGDFYEECDGPLGVDGTDGVQHSDMILGTALARYHYDATPDEAGGTIITMNEGDELLLLERDMGDGWTRVRHRISNAEGFVPTSYLDCKWYGASTSR